MESINSENSLICEQALNELKNKVNLRDKMCGVLYWNVLNDESCQLANKCLSLGCNRNEIEIILGAGTFHFNGRANIYGTNN